MEALGHRINICWLFISRRATKSQRWKPEAFYTFCIIFSILFIGCEQESGEPFQIWIGGDLHLGEGKEDVLKEIAGTLKGGVGIVNLEGPVKSPAKTIRQEEGRIFLYNLPDRLAQLKAHGISVAGIANNHQNDAGKSGISRTISALEKAGIQTCGGSRVAILEKSGVKIAVCAFNLANAIPDSLSLILNAARKKSDILIVTFHVTAPPIVLPTRLLRQAADITVKAGVDVIAAHGTHALAAIEKKGNTIIAWGLGNLAFHCDCTQEKDGLILKILVDPGRKNKISSASALPIEAGLQGKPARLHPDTEFIFKQLKAIGSDEDFLKKN